MLTESEQAIKQYALDAFDLTDRNLPAALVFVHDLQVGALSTTAAPAKKLEMLEFWMAVQREVVHVARRAGVFNQEAI